MIIKTGLYVMATLAAVSLLTLAAVNSDAKKGEAIIHQEFLQTQLKEAKPQLQFAKVKSGDTAGLILNNLAFSANETANVIQAARTVYPLKNIHIGHKFIHETLDTASVITYQIDAKQELTIASQSNDEWKAEITPRHVSSRVDVIGATIEDSLFWDAAKAGLADNLILQLVDIFAWDIDFARDLRKGDSFKVLFEESFDDEGKQVQYKILAATFINRGRVYSGVRYKNQKGDIEYYDSEGRNLRKTYLKSPVKYSRISSRFTMARKHPVLGYTRAHRGVDYAAKTGTPIHAIGDGKIVYKGRKGGYGRFIEIRHNNGIHSTAYAHMSKYARGMRKGKYVKQGQVIGYVGMSGLATGPHLHFEFRSRGRAVNPLKVKHKAAEPVDKNEMSAFRLKAKDMMRLMSQFDRHNTWG
ncbi:MAG: peptidoglycan DD-metalloendopeptidase family protein [Ghiorsea sp.]